MVYVYQGNANQPGKYPVTRVTVILPHNDDGYWSLVAEGIDEEEAAIGAEYNIDISTMIPQLNYNTPQMTDILKQQIAAQVDVIVIQGNEDPEFRKALQEAYDQGIKIICVDTDLKNFQDHLYIGTDNYKAGQLMGEKLVELTGGTAKVAVVSGESGYLNLEQRWNGFMDTVKAYPGIEVVDLQYDNYDGLTFMHLYHKLHEKADTLVCLEGTAGQTLSQLYEERRPEYKYIIGFDINSGVKNKVIDGVVKQDTNQMGRRVVDEIANNIKTGDYSSDYIYTDIQWLTIDNYDEVIK
jgi:ABC-type sugar transport system substrate-binding protein